MSGDWTRIVRLHEIARGPLTVDLEPDAGRRAAIAGALGLESLPRLKARITVRPWLDGAEISGRLEATVEQVCGVSLEPFEQPLAGDIEVRVVPAGSPHAQPEAAGELELDLEAPDPPDELADDAIDLAHYVVEQLALEIDPFPRKPGAAFDYEPPGEPESPFAVLKNLKDPKA